jgi:hypothetical protein
MPVIINVTNYVKNTWHETDSLDMQLEWGTQETAHSFGAESSRKEAVWKIKKKTGT